MYCIFMKEKSFFLISGIIFGLVGIIHLLRSLYSWGLIVENVEIPVWISYISVGVLGYMAFWAFRLRK